jgi:hypothetical protein
MKHLQGLISSPLFQFENTTSTKPFGLIALFSDGSTENTKKKTNPKEKKNLVIMR